MFAPKKGKKAATSNPRPWTSHPIKLAAPKGNTRSHMKKNRILRDINSEHLHDIDLDNVLEEANSFPLIMSSYGEPEPVHNHLFTSEQYIRATFKLAVSPHTPDLAQYFRPENSHQPVPWEFIELVSRQRVTLSGR